MAYDVVQISNLVNDSVADALGKSAQISTLDSTGIVSLGKQLDSIDNGYEGFFKALSKRIVKTAYAVRMYESNTRHVLRDEHEYGAFVQKVYTEMPNAVDNSTWDIPNESGEYKQHSPYDVEGTITVSSLIFGGKGTWTIEFIRPIQQIKEAFLSLEGMMAFIDALYLTAENAFKLEEERIVALAVSTAMADCVNGGNARNLLAEYNSGLDNPITVAECMRDADFLRFASREINDTIKNMRTLSTVFNKAGYATFTKNETLVVEFLSKFASALDTYLASDTFHKELVALPNGYESVPFWQNSGKNFAFDDVSKIAVKNEDFVNSFNDDGEIIRGGIIGFVRDEELVAAHFGSRRSWELVNPRDEIVIHGEKAEKGYAVDNHMNGVVFYVADAGSITYEISDTTNCSVSANREHANIGQPIVFTASLTDGHTITAFSVNGTSITAVGNTYTYIPTSDDDITVSVTVS